MFQSARRSLVGSMLLLLSAPFGSLACAPHGGEPAKGPIGTSNDVEALSTELEQTQKKEKVEAAPPSEDIVQKSAKPFFGYRNADAKTLGEEELLTHLAAADGICIGERHDNPLDHFAQLRTIAGLLERREMRGFELGVALEMVPKSQESTLDAYANQELDDAQFEEESNWNTQWGYPIQFYRPQLRAVRRGGGALLALGVAKELTRAIAESGIEELSENHQRLLPRIDRHNTEHRNLFDLLMKGHPTGSAHLENYYEAQLVWDESMARSSAAWLSERRPGRKLIILAGTAHCHHSAIPSRVERGTDLLVVNLLPVEGGVPLVQNGPDSSVEEEISAGYDFQMVFQK